MPEKFLLNHESIYNYIWMTIFKMAASVIKMSEMNITGDMHLWDRKTIKFLL